MKEESCWLQISSGRGPVECCWVVGKLAAKIIKEANRRNMSADIIESTPGPAVRTFKSILISFSGQRSFVSEYTGTVLWIEQSPFRLNHKRKNWYVGVKAIHLPVTPNWSDKDVKIETMRASGPGGQHVNKIESAVRITHLPTGITVTAREERSQRMNKKLAFARLTARLSEKKEKIAKNHQTNRWHQHNELERGNPKIVYESGRLKCLK